MKKTNLTFSLILIITSLAFLSCNNEKAEPNKDTIQSSAIEEEKEVNSPGFDEREFSSEIRNMVDSISYVIGMNIGGSFLKEFPEINFSIFEKGLSDHLENSPNRLIDLANGQQLVQKYFMQKRVNSAINSPNVKPTLNNSSTTIETTEDSISYAMGNNIGENITGQFPECNTVILKQGLKNKLFESTEPIIDSLLGQQIVNEYFMKKQELARAEELKQYEKTKEKGIQFLAENKNKKGVITTESGLQYIVLKEGSGKQPTASSNVTVHYHGTTPEGIVFDSSVERGEPTSFGLNQVIKGWTEGVALMKEGAKYKFFIPQELAYGANPRPGGPIKPYMPLVFEVELISVN